MNKKIKGENNDEDYEIVFSDDPNFVKKKDIKPSVEIIPNLIKINIRIEKKQRGGKIVTVLFGFPPNDAYFNDLTKKLKNHCGTGGTLKDDKIELQGDHKEKVRTFLEKLGFKV